MAYFDKSDKAIEALDEIEDILDILTAPKILRRSITAGHEKENKMGVTISVINVSHFLTSLKSNKFYCHFVISTDNDR